MTSGERPLGQRTGLASSSVSGRRSSEPRANLAASASDQTAHDQCIFTTDRASGESAVAPPIAAFSKVMAVLADRLKKKERGVVVDRRERPAETHAQQQQRVR